MTPTTILSVLDSSTPANDAALATALSLARRHDAAVHAVHVGGPRRADRTPGSAAGDAFAAGIARVVADSGFAGVEVVPAVLSGTPVRALADYADRHAADLVVVGRRARRRDVYWSTGSFAAALGKAVASPTVAVRSAPLHATGAGTTFRNIVVPVDFSEVSLRALTAALVLAQQSGGHLLLLHVLDGFRGETVYTGSRALRLRHDFHERVTRVNHELRALIPPDALNWSDIDVATVSGLAHDAIAAAADERRADLVVLGLPRRTRLEDVVVGSTVHRVLRRTTSPVLLVPGPATVRLARPGDAHDGAAAAWSAASGPLVEHRATSPEDHRSWH